MMLILPIHEHCMFFHLFISPSIHFFNMLWFSECKSFTSLVKIIPKYLHLFVAMVNGIVCLVSLSKNLILMYKNAIDFWMLILYYATLPNSFLKSSRFLVKSLGFSMDNIMLSVNNDSFTSSFPIWMPFISSYLITVASTSNIILLIKG
uniref:Uncharacterized protein n=1 Tax=Myotis myotis TaxID=51298 RepID=A0A7J7Z4R1_MYOMY|nr:hypothetical protein mMyoMyo1_010584 [Myotis myotis]